MKIVFATANIHKLIEVRQILGEGFEIVSPADMGISDDIPEEQPTLAGNAMQKARWIYERTGLSCFADDTGLEVVALDGAPGVYSARYAGEGKDQRANMELLLENLRGVDDRTARFRTVIALILDGREYLFEGEVRGKITTAPRGLGGFGYDPVFVPSGHKQTFAEMSAGLKNTMSHRAQAVGRLAEYLKNLTPGQDDLSINLI